MKALRTLRGRLVLTLLSALVVGLLLMGFTSVALLNRSLIERTDQRLAEMSMPWEEGRRPPPEPRHHPPTSDRTQLPTDFRVLIFTPSGEQVGDVIGSTGDEPGGPLVHDPERGPRVGTVPDRRDGTDWRVRRVSMSDGRTVVLALSLDDARATVQQLIIIELVVGGVVLLVLAFAAAGTVRLSLRPLARIENTADAIAAGQMDRRVPDSDPRTETGRLGKALNTMLGRLTDALGEREQSEQRLRRFVADASHELRTPLTSIRGFAELYRRSESPAPKDVRMMMQRIESEAVRMGGMVEDMLLLARLDRERSIDLVDLDLLPVARDVVQDARARAPEREITLGGVEGLRVLGDGARLSQVLTNLVNNALVHTPPGTSITVDVDRSAAGEPATAASGAELAPGAPVAAVSVTDTGPGIAEEHASRIFDRFYRVDDARTSGGTGLGLAITAALAQAHNGRLELHRNSHGGSTFRLLLPLL
ncbi:sensory box histidine kinase PhoR [Saccharopolyspora halophila]|uniref:histidine kinase n=1 Tax=Saccharopolyspora halophila TaxID=405551 RepID=A0ABP5TN61_9PSEU